MPGPVDCSSTTVTSGPRPSQARPHLVTGSWQHVVMTRKSDRVKVYLNGDLEIDGDLPITYPEGCEQLQFGGRNDNFANLRRHARRSRPL